ncbi:Hsp90 cochaperone [Martiniozyma asiatica (nom. inval.)]|nr:Hsp90 cochaperone [Martiniozyma asiatica]
MLTPRFEVSQDEEFIYVKIHISNIRFSAAAVEMVVNDSVFIFSLPPYYLRLRFPNSLIEDERATSEFVPREECIKCRVPKLNKGEDFKDLDLTAKLLARLGEPTATTAANLNLKKPFLIEELDTDSNENDSRVSQVEQEALNYDWEVPQMMPSLETSLDTTVKYGFNNQYSEQLTPSLENGNDINELSAPDNLKPDDRIMERMIKENIKFDMEYYANDYITAKYLPEESSASGLANALLMKSSFQNAFESNSSKEHVDIKFTQEEHDKMADLPRRSYIIDDPRPIYYSAMCILFGYAYELRSFDSEVNVESAWCIGKLAPQIGCLDSQLIQSNNNTESNMLKVVVLTMARRSLGWPLFRHFDLIKATWNDVYWILRCGKRAVLKALLATRELFRKHDIYYIYCKILLDDLCAWVLRDDGCNDNVLRNLAHALKQEVQQLSKKDIVFEKILDNSEANVDGEFEFINLEDIEGWADETYQLSIQ